MVVYVSPFEANLPLFDQATCSMYKLGDKAGQDKMYFSVCFSAKYVCDEDKNNSYRPSVKFILGGTTSMCVIMNLFKMRYRCCVSKTFSTYQQAS